METAERRPWLHAGPPLALGKAPATFCSAFQLQEETLRMIPLEGTFQERHKPSWRLVFIGEDFSLSATDPCSPNG